MRKQSSLLLFILTLVVLSCQEETALKNVCADPLGAEDITLENNDQFCYKEGFNACFVMQFTTTSQVIKAVDNASIYPGTMIAMIIDVGAVSCLGDVTGKPTSGFVASAEALEKHGYVVKLPDNTYGRLFVDSWTKSSSGVVSEINITWQYAF